MMSRPPQTLRIIIYTTLVSVAQARTAYNSQHEWVPSGKTISSVDMSWLLSSSKSHALVLLALLLQESENSTMQKMWVWYSHSTSSVPG